MSLQVQVLVRHGKKKTKAVLAQQRYLCETHVDKEPPPTKYFTPYNIHTGDSRCRSSRALLLTGLVEVRTSRPRLCGKCDLFALCIVDCLLAAPRSGRATKEQPQSSSMTYTNFAMFRRTSCRTRGNSGNHEEPRDCGRAEYGLRSHVDDVSPDEHHAVRCEASGGNEMVSMCRFGGGKRKICPTRWKL